MQVQFQIVPAASEEEGCEPIVVDTDRCIAIFDNMIAGCATGSGEYCGGDTADGCYYYMV